MYAETYSIQQRTMYAILYPTMKCADLTFHLQYDSAFII